MEGGADIRFVQELLGHASLETTQIYTRVTISKLKAVYEACHPSVASPGSQIASTSEMPVALDVLSELEAEVVEEQVAPGGREETE